MASKEAVPGKLYTLQDVAKFVGRSYQLVRAYYSKGLLPDPIHTNKHPSGYKIRFFDYREVRQLREFFRGIESGATTIPHKQRRKRGRKG